MLFFLSINIQASVIKHIYEVSVPVVSQVKNVRQTAFGQGLIEVSVRVSGSSLTPGQLNLKQAAQLVRQYRYKVMDQAEISAYMEVNDTLIAPKFKLWIQFDDAKVKQLLRDNALPIWGYQRPNVLVWLAVKDGKSRYLLKKSDKSQIKDAVISASKRRGLPIIWPEYDEKDRLALTFTDVWGEFLGPIRKASQRYPVDAIILGRMSWINGGWSVNWSLIVEDKTESWALSAMDLNVLMSSGIGVATDNISSRFAVLANSENDGELLLRVNNLNEIGQYAKASHYLSSLAPVKNVYALSINQYQVDFYIQLSGDESDLKRNIALGRVLVPDEQAKKTKINNRRIINVNDIEQSEAAQGMGLKETLIEEPLNILQYRLNK